MNRHRLWRVAGVGIALLALVALALVPPALDRARMRQSIQRVEMPPDDAPPAVVVERYLAAIKARDAETARALWAAPGERGVVPGARDLNWAAIFVEFDYEILTAMIRTSDGKRASPMTDVPSKTLVPVRLSLRRPRDLFFWAKHGDQILNGEVPIWYLYVGEQPSGQNRIIGSYKTL